MRTFNDNVAICTGIVQPTDFGCFFLAFNFRAQNQYVLLLCDFGDG